MQQEATRNKCIASSNKCLTSSNKKLLGTSLGKEVDVACGMSGPTRAVILDVPVYKVALEPFIIKTIEKTIYNIKEANVDNFVQ